MNIPPCTTGKHSIVDDTPKEKPKPTAEETEANLRKQTQAQPTLAAPVPRIPAQQTTPRPSPSPAPPEDESDDPDATVPEGATCKRRGCNTTSNPSTPRADEQCVHHPGQALFHEGSKGWTCCKRRVLEFDEFMKIPGCTTKARHLYIGKPNQDSEEQLSTVRNDFYQTPTTVIASLYLKKIDKETSRVEFVDANTVDLDLKTADRKRYRTSMELSGPIKPEESGFKIMGTKLELTLKKADGAGWGTLRADDRPTGEIIQSGRAGRA